MSPVRSSAVGAEPHFCRPQTTVCSTRLLTPKHLAEKILTSKSALEGERKHVTVLFADLKGSMELLADRDPEEALKLLDGRRYRTRSCRSVAGGSAHRAACRARPRCRAGVAAALSAR
jgi:class 3 adenylate cyclase